MNLSTESRTGALQRRWAVEIILVRFVRYGTQRYAYTHCYPAFRSLSKDDPLLQQDKNWKQTFVSHCSRTPLGLRPIATDLSPPRPICKVSRVRACPNGGFHFTQRSVGRNTFSSTLRDGRQRLLSPTETLEKNGDVARPVDSLGSSPLLDDSFIPV